MWLVPNPLKDIRIDRNKSLNFSFDIDSRQNSSNILILIKPALVQILPNSDRLTWKLTERGELKTGGAASQSAMANNTSIDPLALTKQIEQIIQARLSSSHNNILKQCQEMIDRSTPPAIPNVPALGQAPLYFTRAKQKEQKNDLVGALLDYDRAIEIDSEYANAYFNKGMIQKNLSSAKDRAGAILSLRIAAKLYKQQGKLEIYQSLSETLQKLDGW